MRDKQGGDTISWAISMLESRVETESLAILASFSLEKHPNSFEVQNYFRRSLKEMGWTIPDDETSLIQYALDVATDIVSGAISPLGAVCKS